MEHRGGFKQFDLVSFAWRFLSDRLSCMDTEWWDLHEIQFHLSINF